MTAQLDHITTALAGRYAIEREIGAGGMATVYLAEDVKHHRRVAIKVLQPTLAAVLGPERFLKEIEVTANLQHPHILPLHDSGALGSLLYYVMPYVEGESLREKINREKQLSIVETVEIAQGVASALDYAHRHDVIHRDIKPENILLHDGQALVADFGIALAVTQAGGVRLTETGLSLGTPEYMSPEQAVGERELTPQSDIYALGTVVYEMLVGEPPHTGGTVQAIVAQVVSTEPRPINAARPAVPVNVEAAVRCALAKVPADRFSRAIDFANGLTNPAFTDPTFTSRVFEKNEHIWRRRALIASGVAVVSMVAAMWGWGRNTATVPQDVARYTLPVELPPRDFQQFDLSRDGNHFVFNGGRAGPVVRALDQMESRSLGLNPNAWQPIFSPNGSAVAFFAGPISTVPTVGGAATRLFAGSQFQNGRIRGASWGDDGFIYFTGIRRGLYRVPAGGGEPAPVTVLDTVNLEYNHRFPDVLPNGKGVLFTSWWADSARIMVYSFENDSATRIALGSTARYMPQGYVLIGTLDGQIQALPFDVHRMTASDVSPVTMIRDVAVNSMGHVLFDVSDNGSLVYLPAWEPKRIVVLLDRAGTETPLMSDSGPFRNPMIAPDGNRVLVERVVAGGHELWVHDMAGGRVRILPRTVLQHAAWSPDGDTLVFGANLDSRGHSLYAKRSDGQGQIQPILVRPGSEFPSQWHANGLILFWPTTANGVWGVPSDGAGQARRLIPDCPADCNHSHLSPNGRFISYYKGSGLGRLVADLTDPLATEQQVDVTGGQSWWSTDGDEIFFVSRRMLVSVKVETEGGLRVSERTDLFEIDQRYSTGLYNFVDPLGRGFVFVKNTAESRPPPIVVVNFHEEVKARVVSR